MKIWVVHVFDNDYATVSGAYSTEQKAQEEIDSYTWVNYFEFREGKCGDEGLDFIEGVACIVEIEVDTPLIGVTKYPNYKAKTRLQILKEIQDAERKTKELKDKLKEEE